MWPDAPSNVKSRLAMLGFAEGFKLEVLPKGRGTRLAICTKFQILSFPYICKWAFDFVSHPEA